MPSGVRLVRLSQRAFFVPIMNNLNKIPVKHKVVLLAMALNPGKKSSLGLNAFVINVKSF